MSQFNTILNARDLTVHTGKALWKYNLTEEEFLALKKSFRFIDRPSQLKPKDCALYYAEWWKRCYDGGKPSKEHIFNSLELNQPFFNSNDLFEYAKLGGELLGFKWLKNHYTLFFRSLLLQGGIPLNQIKNNQGRYRDFLKEILKINPLSIDDFINRNEVISLLPKSSQNEVVYESCLQIVQAILNNEENSLEELNDPVFVELVDVLIGIRNNATINVRTKKLKFNFHLDVNKKQLFLSTKLPNLMSANDISSLLNINIDDLSFEYNLFINDDFVAKFIKRNDNKYVVKSFQTSIIINEDIHPQIVMYDFEEEEYSLDNLVSDFIDLETPTLLNKINENEYILEHTRNTSLETGYLLVPNNYSSTNPIELIQEINLFDTNYLIYNFENEVVLANETEEFKFKTNVQNTFDWNIITNAPEWLHKSNIPLVRDAINVIAYDKEAKRINNLNIEFKLINSNEWKTYHQNVFLPLGALDIRLIHHESVEYDRVYNIKNFDINAHLSIHNPCIIFDNRFELNCEVYPSDFYEVVIENSTAKFNLIDNHRLPSSIKMRLSKKGQAKGAIFQVKSPFQGVKIVDKDDVLVENKALFTDHLRGFRLISNAKNKNIEVSIFNQLNPQIKINRSIKKVSTSLQNYTQYFQQLFKLHNVTDPNNKISFEVYEVLDNDKRKLLNRYEVKQFSIHLNYAVSDLNNKLEFLFDHHANVEVEDLFAIPLDCEVEDIDLIQLNNENGFYRLNKIVGEKYIVFSKDSANYKIKPEFISINPQNELTDLADRINRIQNFKNELLEKDFTEDIWQKYLVYYYICKENNLPFSTFDILKATSTSSKLASKAFCFLSENFDGTNHQFSGNDFLDFQKDIGFSFNWIAMNDWAQYHNHFHAIAMMHNTMQTNFILTAQPINNFVLNQEFTNVRQRLGVRVISELPTIPLNFIPNEFKNRIPHVNNNNNLYLLAAYPMLIALSITNQHDYIWHEQGENMRKRILYLMDLDQEWYTKAINYYTTTLN